MKTRKGLYFFLILVAVCCVALSGLFPTEVSGQTQVPGGQIKNGAIGYSKLSDSLKPAVAYKYTGVIAFMVDDSSVRYARTALDVASGKLTSGAFVTTTRDSLRGVIRGFVRYADSAGFANGLSDGSINDSTMFKGDFWDAFMGRNAVPYIFNVQNSNYSDTATYSTTAGVALIADSALAAPTQVNAAFADSARVAYLAYVAITSDTTASDGSVTWASLSTAMKSAIKTDSVQLAKRADSLNANAIDNGGMFTSAVKDTYLVNLAFNQSFKTAPNVPLTGSAALSGTNKVIDSTGYKKNTVRLAKPGVDPPIRFTASVDCLATAYTVMIDTSTRGDGTKFALRLKDASGDSWAVKDSTYVTLKILSEIAAEAVQMGGVSGNTPVKIHIANGSGGLSPVRGDILVDTSGIDTTWEAWVYAKGSDVGLAWQPLSGSTGGTTATSLGRTASPNPVSVDSVMYIDVSDSVSAQTMYYPHILYADSALPQTAASLLGSTASRWLKAWISKVKTDTLSVTGDSITGNMMFNGLRLLPRNSGNSHIGISTAAWGDGYFTTLYTHPTNGIKLVAGSILPQGSQINVADIGSAAAPFDDIYNNDLVTTGTINNYDGTAGHTDIELLSGASGGITISNGTIAITNGSLTSAGDITTSAGFLVIGTRDLDGDDIAAIDSSCSPTASNPLVSTQKMVRAHKAMIASADSLRLNWRDAHNLFIRALVRNGCQTSDTNFLGMNNWVLPDIPIDPPVRDSGWFAPDSLVSLLGWDSSSNTLYPAESNNPMQHGEYIVSHEYDGRFGTRTGYFATIQTALDSIPNIRFQWTHGAGKDTLDIYQTAAGLPMLYFGNRCVDTLQYIPDQFKVSGAAIYFPGAATNKRYWATVGLWINDTLFQLSDADTARFDGSSDTTTAILSASNWTVTIKPAKQGGVVVSNARISIKGFGPVTIRGEGETVTAITNATNAFGGEPAEPTIFIMEGDIFGLPVTLEDMTLLSASGSSPAYALEMNGRVTLRNISAQVEGGGLGFLRYRAIATGSDSLHNGIVCENVTVAQDSDMTVFNLADTCFFQSIRGTYGLSGSAGMGLYAEKWMPDPPQFSYDQFFAGINPSFTFKATENTDSVSCSFVETVGANFSVSGFAAVSVGNNLYNAARTARPIKLSGKWFRYQTPIAPK